jgi:hypothetical protein
MVITVLLFLIAAAPIAALSHLISTASWMH